MGEIIKIGSGMTIDAKTQLELDKLINLGLDEIPENVQKILNTGIKKPVLISTEEFKKLLYDYILNKIKESKTDVNVGINLSINYLSNLLLQLTNIEDNVEIKDVIKNPYFTYWAGKGDYKKAGDASVYKYLFNKSDKNFETDSNSNLLFAMNGYLNHFGDENFSNSIGIVLPKIKGIHEQKDFFQRGLKSI